MTQLGEHLIKSNMWAESEEAKIECCYKWERQGAWGRWILPELCEQELHLLLFIRNLGNLKQIPRNAVACGAQAASKHTSLPGKENAAMEESFQVKKAVVFCKNCHQQRIAETQRTRQR